MKDRYMEIRSAYLDDQQMHRDAFDVLVAGHSAFRHIGSFSDVRKVTKLVEDGAIDLLFLDVVLGEQEPDGIDVAASLLQYSVPIVFLTSHVEFALKAFDVCAFDYIVKPAVRSDLDELVAKIGRRHRQFAVIHRSQLEALDQFRNDLSGLPQRIFVNFVGEVRVVPLNEVLFFRSESRYTHIYMVSGDELVSSKTLKFYDDAINGHPDFFRIHRSIIVNLRHIRSLLTSKIGNRHSVEMSNGSRLEVSIQVKDMLMERLLRIA